MGVVVMCVRSGSVSTLASFDSIAGALDAAAVVPCSPLCAGVHVIAWQGTGGRVECEFVGPDRRDSSLAVQLDRLYRRTPTKVPVECYPHPSVLNPPQSQKTRPR